MLADCIVTAPSLLRLHPLQLPPKRRQVIRLPKPSAAEWPKLAPGRKRHADDSEGSASSAGEEDEEADEGAGNRGEEEEGGGGRKRPAKPMSSAHRTGLAKASAVIDWLTTALGVRSGGSAEIAKFERKDRADPPMIPPTLMMSAKSPNYPNPKLQRNMSMAHNVAVTLAVHRSADGTLWNWGRSRRAVRWTHCVGGRCPVLSTGKCGRQAGRRVVGNNIAYL